jgi:hypothetical protein
VESSDELSAGDQDIIKLLGKIKLAEAEYPPELLAARRSAFLRQMERAGEVSFLEAVRASIRRLFAGSTTTSTLPQGGLMRVSLGLASLLAVVLIGSLLFSRAMQTASPSPSQPVLEPPLVFPTSTVEGAIIVCAPDDQTASCPPAEFDLGQDLADQRNGTARPAVSNDVQANQDGSHQAAHVNDGRSGASWVSTGPESWIKIDLGKVTRIDTVSLREGSSDASMESTPGHFVIAVARSDVYEDGNSADDSTEYAQVFDSERNGLGGAGSEAETIHIQFRAVEARFVKITFQKAGTAIEEVGVFLVQPPELAEQPTTAPAGDSDGTTPTAMLSLMDTAISAPTGAWLSTDMPSSISTDTVLPTDTPTPLPIRTLSPVETSTPFLAEPLPSDTPIPLPTFIPPTVELPPVSSEPIVVTGNGQTLTFMCNDNAVEIRGHANTVTLLGSCSSIIVIGSDNLVFWQFGAPVITNQGNDNIIRQL